MNLPLAGSGMDPWLAEIPWVAPWEGGGDFHFYWQKVHEGKIEAQNFLIFESGSHELAHLICCQDENILDPYWGFSPVGDPFQNPKGEDAAAEIEVQAVTLAIDIYSHGDKFLHRSGEYSSFDPVKTFLEQWKYFGTSLWSYYGRNETFPTIKSAYPLIKLAGEKWSIIKIWNELERKRVIVHRLLA